MKNLVQFSVFFVVLGGFLFAGSVIAGDAPQEWIDVEVLVNVLDGADANGIDDAIARANEILGQARIRLVRSGTDPNATADSDDSGALDREERDQARQDGQEELDENVADGEGLKITITGDCDANDPNTVGLAVHGHPVVIVEPNPDDPNEYGNTVAHELAHALTLDYDLYDGNDPNRLMWGYTGGGTELTDEEVNEIRRHARERGTAYFIVPEILPGSGGVAVPPGIEYIISGKGAGLDLFDDVTIQLDPDGILEGPNDPTIQYADIGQVRVFCQTPRDYTGKTIIRVQLGQSHPDWWVDSFFDVFYEIPDAPSSGHIRVELSNWEVTLAEAVDPFGDPSIKIPVDVLVRTEYEFTGDPHIPIPHSKSMAIEVPTEIIQLDLVRNQPIQITDVNSTFYDFRNGFSSTPIELTDSLNEPFPYKQKTPPCCSGLTLRETALTESTEFVGVDIMGCGFTPGKELEVLLDEQIFPTGIFADPDGEVYIGGAGPVFGPPIPVCSGVHSVIVREVDDNLNTGGANWAAAYFDASEDVTGDLDNDEDVDFYDLAIFADNWLYTKQ